MNVSAVRYASILAVLAASSCLFSKSDEPESNVVVVNNTTGNNASDVSIGPATVTTLDCSPNRTIFVRDTGVPAGFEIDDRAAIDFSTNAAGLYRPTLPQATFELLYLASAAWAKVVDGEIRVAVAGAVEEPTGEVATGDGFHTATQPAGDATQVHALMLDPAVGELKAGASPFQVHVLTDAGVRTVIFRLAGPDGDPMLVGDWTDEQLQREMSAVGIVGAQSVDFAPVLSRSGAAFSFEFGGLLFAASGPSSSKNVLGVARFEPSGAITGVSTVDAIDNRLDSPEVFAERFAYGLDEGSGGKPRLLVLARDPDGEDYRPRILTLGSSGYTADTSESWPLPPDTTIGSGTFTFLDGYEADVTYVEGGGGGGDGEGGDGEGGDGEGVFVDPATAKASYGYAALAEDGDRLLLARPGGTAGSDVLEAELDGATHIYALRNLPLDPTVGAVAFPTIAIIDGDKLSLARWDFGADVELLPDALGGRFTDVTHLTRPVLVNGGAGFDESLFLAFRGRVDGEIGIGLFPFGPSARAFSSVVCGNR